VRKLLCSVALVGLCSAVSCGQPPRSPQPAAPRAPVATAPLARVVVDPLGPRPIPEPPAPFRPPLPQVLVGPAHSTVWLLERHDLPIVAMAVVFPHGSAAEPASQAGLASVTASMLTEGAGDRDALAFSAATSDLGARLAASAELDTTIVTLEVLTRRLDAALGLLADAILRPRFEKKDYDRVRSLWVNALKARAHDPTEVARVATSLALFGGAHPYGHPRDGTLATASNVRLADVTRWHKAVFRPDTATFVVAGDVTKDEILWRISSAFAAWTAPLAPPLPVSAAPFPTRSSPTAVVVDRPDAPQVVISLASAGVAASDPASARLDMLNLALGGSFTSRLNQNLREDHGWSYGVRSRFDSRRGTGMFVVSTAVRADAVTDALRETKKEIGAMANGTLSQEEIPKLRALVHGNALEKYGALRGALGSLAFAASLGLGPDRDARVLDSQLTAQGADLAALASKYLDLYAATVVLVGPKDLAIQAILANGFPPPEQWDPEGRPVQQRHHMTR